MITGLNKLLGNKYQQAISIGSTINTIANNDNLDWETKYDLIFDTNKMFEKLGLRFNYHTLDTSYQEDVNYYLRELNRQMEVWKILTAVSKSE